MSNVLLGVGTPLEDVQTPILEDVPEDVRSMAEDADLKLQPNSASLDETLAGILLPYLDFASWKALRGVSRAWYAAIDRVAPTRIPASSQAPNEIIQQIYGYLGPKDFNAARHTCRRWMRASLDKHLLAIMLQRMGHWSTAQSDLRRRNHRDSPYSSIVGPSEEWTLSRRLSRECALSSAWTGNGLSSHRGRKTIVEVLNTDFTDLTNGPTGQRSGGLVFSTSICGKSLLVARDTLIYVYESRGAALVPVTSVVAPRRVLSMSMDSSSGRNAFAALLEGRMGMVCELHCQQHSEVRHHTPFDSINVQSGHEAVLLHEVNDRRMFFQNHVNQSWNLHFRGAPSRATPDGRPCSHTMPIEGSNSTFYRHLCSEDDPPRSVSICSQRRCVAFGCSAGIELHWIDALTGQSLSRWFPLTAPSDYLYFLAPRPGFESAKKLRLISSAAHPDDRPSISRKFFLGRPSLSSFWGSFGFESSAHRASGPNCDHYHAVPLSDGHHILFIDPHTTRLFMGCDAPLGGPTKLLRKIMLAPPPSMRNAPPRLYSAASDMSSGARIVAVFDDTIVFYSVPPNVCDLSRAEQKAESWDAYNAPSYNERRNNPNHWLNWWDEPCPSNRWGDSSVWPIAIHGTVIGTLRSVCEVTVSSTSPDITIWGFALDAHCKTWQLRNYADAVVCERKFICRSGLVHEAYAVDEDGDIIMSDVAAVSTPSPLLESETQHSAGFDGCASQSWVQESKMETTYPSAVVENGEDGTTVKRIPAALSVEKDEFVDFLDFRGCDAWVEGGDVVFVL